MAKDLPEPDELDLSAVKGAVLRRKGFICLVVVVCFFLAALYCLLAMPVYRVASSVLIENRNSSVMGDSGGAMVVTRDVSLAQKALADSTSVLQAAAKIARTAEWEELMVDGQVPDPTAPFQPKNAKSSVEGQLLFLEVRHVDAGKAATLANAWAAAFVEEMNRRERYSSVYATGFLDKEVPALREDWIRKQEALQKFQVETKFDPREADRGPVWVRYIELSQKLTQAESAVLDVQMEHQLWEQSKGSADKLMEHPRAQRHPSLLNFERVLQDQRKETVAALLKYRTGSELARVAEQQLKELERFRDGLLERIGAELKAELDSAVRRVEEYSKLYTEACNAYEEMKSKNARYQVLVFEVDSARKQYDAAAERLGQVALQGKVDYSYARVWDRAEAPKKPFWPNWPLLLAAGVFAGLVLAGIGVFGFEMTDDTIHSAKLLGKELGLNLAGTIPLADPRMGGTLYDLARTHPRAVPTESMRMVRATLNVSLKTARGASGAGHLVLVSSPNEREGKSFVSSNLANLCAMSGQRVLLVDVDVYRRTLTHHYGLGDRAGLIDLPTLGSSKLIEAAHPAYPNLWFTGAGSHDAENATALFESPETLEFFRDVRGRFDYIILDAAPILLVADASVLTSRCDATLLVVRSRKTRLAEVERAVDVLSKSKAESLMLIVNGVDRSDMQAGGYGYYGKYGRSAYYGASGHHKEKGHREGPAPVKARPAPVRNDDGPTEA